VATEPLGSVFHAVVTDNPPFNGLPGHHPQRPLLPVNPIWLMATLMIVPFEGVHQDHAWGAG